MTTSEQDALREFQKTPEEMAALTQKMDEEARKLKVQTGPGDPAPANSAKPAKKPRSDKGTKRVKTTDPQPTGALSREQASRLLDLIATRDSRRTEWDMYEAQKEKAGENAEAAQQRFDDADVEAIAFIREITAK